MSNEELVAEIQAGIKEQDNMEILYQKNYGLILCIAKKYAHREAIEDLLQEAYFGLYEAVKRYEATAGVFFISYATFWIKQAIQRYLENNGRCIRIPVHMQENIYKYNRIMATFYIKQGRKPTERELCYYIGVNKKTLEEIKKTVYIDKLQSLDEHLPGSDDMEIGDTVRDHGTDIENDIIERMIEKSKQTELWQIVKDNVTAEENEVIKARFRKNMSLDEVGQLIWKSREMARQIEAKALRKLRRARITRILEDKFEVNYSRGYKGNFARFKYTGNSIVEDIVIRNDEYNEWRKSRLEALN